MRIQKGKYRFSKRELWNLDETLMPIIRTALEQFLEAKQWGIPNEVYVDYIADERGISLDEARQWVKDNRDEYGNVIGYEDSSMMGEYYKTKIIPDMIFAFTSHPDYFEVEKSPYDFNFAKSGAMQIIVNDGVTSEDIQTYNNRSLEYDKMINERCDRGRQYFARYFHSLWD